MEEILSEAQLLKGLVVPIHTPTGRTYCALFSGLQRELNTSEVATLATSAMEYVNQLIISQSEQSKVLQSPLSTRESQCLNWTAQGKTSFEIGVILSLSEHTINNYLVKACAKLGAANRSHAVAKAMKMGLVNTDS